MSSRRSWPVAGPSSSSLSNTLPTPSLHPRHPSRSSSHTSLLNPVLEDEADQSCCKRNTRRSPPMTSSSASMSRASSAEEMIEWTVDLMAVQGGRARWLERERVVLVLGEVPYLALECLISNPSFAHSLILTHSTPPQGDSYPSIHTLSSLDLEDAVNEAMVHSATYRKKNKKKYRANYSSSSAPSAPFDAILHFLPSPVHFEPTMALQRMLREAIMATTVATACLASFTHTGQTSKAKSKSGEMRAEMPIPLVHVIPAGSPGALPLVIERYLLQLLPSLNDASRAIRPLVVSSSAWSTRTIPSTNAPASDAILFGGLNPVGSVTRVSFSSWDRVIPSSSPTNSPPMEPTWSYSLDKDRRDSSTSTSTSTSISSSSQHEAITPLSGSYTDMHDTLRISHPPSRLSFVETFVEDDGEQVEPEIKGKKESKGMMSWMRRKVTT